MWAKLEEAWRFFPISHTILTDSLRILISVELSLDVFGFMTRLEFVMIFFPAPAHHYSKYILRLFEDGNL